MAPREPLIVEEDIRRAWTLPAWVFTDPEVFERTKAKVFAPSWQLISDLDQVKAPGQVHPFMLLEGCLDEPLLLSRDREDQIHCLSNVCTHRGNLVCENDGVQSFLRCRYHGRRFALDGKFQSMPEFEQAIDFPSSADDLPRVEHGSWGKLVFAAIAPELTLDELLAPVVARCSWVPVENATLDLGRSRDYLVQANWALYCDNYLEGFHIPFVHPALNGALEYEEYRTELFPAASLQVGVAKGAEDTFDLPPESPDAGQRIAAYYFWIFPNTMLNIYPWGVSVNIVRPLSVDRTKVSFLSYVWDPDRLGRGAGAELDRVEREDEVVVESVQRGVRSSLYGRGRYSPAREQGVHHFHRLLAKALSD